MPHPTVPHSSELGHIARLAGELSLKYFRKNPRVSEKSDNQGLVTEADLAAEQLIKQFIREKYPTHSILAEESGLDSVSETQEETPLWIVDPIDGTTNFSKGNPYYCVSIAFGLKRKDNIEILSAAIYQPTTQDLYTADKEKGSYCNSEKMSMSNVTHFHLASIATGWSYNKGGALKKVIDSLYKVQTHSLGTRINGAAALDLALTARGILQGFYELKLQPWDMAAGFLLATEAGGKVTNMSGAPFNPLTDRDIVCAAPAIHGPLLECVAPNFIE